jgi:hypothetical protein
MADGDAEAVPPSRTERWVDQDSGRGTGAQTPRRENRTGPRHRLDTDRPPSGAANPLPRRSAQGHIEPQLRTPGGAGTGTPFTPFAADDEQAPGSGPGKTPSARAAGGAAEASPGRAAGGAAEATETSAAADFHEGTGRGRRSTEPPTS